jgi:RNA polymerase sigma-70 factor (ECF subfamily)
LLELWAEFPVLSPNLFSTYTLAHLNKAECHVSFSDQGDRFPATRYSVVAAAQSGDAALRVDAMSAIALAYWKPIYKYARLRWNMDAEDARDFTQDFFVRLVEGEFLNSYDPGKGRLRTFLRTCIDRLFLNQARDSQRQKRGGAAVHISLDFDQADRELALASHPESLDEYFDKEWTRSLFALAVERLRRHCELAGKIQQFQVFEQYDLADGELRPSYADLAGGLGLAVSDVTNYLSFARREFRRCVLEQLREMTGSEEEFRREAKALLGETGDQ